jgi:hypothetical protein
MPASGLATSKSRPLRCFVGFFGITRRLDRVIESIEQHIFAPLDQAGIATVCAAHLNRPDILDAPRSGETNVQFEIDVDALMRLRLDRQMLEPQSDERIAAPLALALGLPLMFGEQDPEGATRRNAVRQLYSLKRLAGIYEDYGPANFDFVILVRPDLRYLDRLPLQQIVAQLGIGGLPGMASLRRRFKPVASLITPSWQTWGGLNDRFAFATAAGARTYLNRMDHLPDYCKTRSEFQAEALLKFAAERDGLQTATTWMRAERVRSDGSVAPRDMPRRRERWRRAIVYPFHRVLQI